MQGRGWVQVEEKDERKRHQRQAAEEGWVGGVDCPNCLSLSALVLRRLCFVLYASQVAESADFPHSCVGVAFWIRADGANIKGTGSSAHVDTSLVDTC